MFGVDPIDENAVVGEQSDEMVRIESTFSGTVETIDSESLPVLTNTGIKLECTLPPDRTVEGGDVVQVVANFSG